MIALKDTLEFGEIKSINLLLGSECNMCCRHCQQNSYKNIVIGNRQITDEVYQLLKNYILFVLKQDGKETFGYKIMFYGGEILLFWNTVKECIVRLTKETDLLRNKVFRFSITTNGLCLTKEIVDFLNEYEVLTIFSYDAPHPFVVRDYVSDDICDLVNHIKYVKIAAFGNAYNYDPLVAYYCLTEKFPKAVISYHPEVFRTFVDMPDDIDAYNWGNTDAALRRLCLHAKSGNKSAKSILNILLHPVFHPEDNYYLQSDGISPCVSGKRFLSITPDGNVCFCFNSLNQVLGTIETESIESVFDKCSSVYKKYYQSVCIDCSVKEFCNYCCARFLKDSDGRYFNCKKFRIPFFTLLRKNLKIFSYPLTLEEKDFIAKDTISIQKKVKMFLKEGKLKNKC